MQILDIDIAAITMEQALDFVEQAIAKPRDKRRLHKIVTINAEGLYLAYHNPKFKALLKQADLITADGSGVLWAAEQYGQKLPGRVTGVDLGEKIAARAAICGWRLFLLGAAPNIAEQAGAKLSAKYPGLIIAGCHDGYFNGQEQAVLQQIAEAQADIVLVALGMPRQEYFIAEHQEQLQAAVALGVGGSFDVWAGMIKRAPLFMQKLRLEWLWRLIKQPSRLGRMMAIPKFMLLVKRERRR